jgi:nucleoside-diphosphate-sugar epimerase
MNRVLVTGASGFIGKHLCERLSQDGYGLRVLVRPGSERFELPRDGDAVIADIRDASAMKAAASGCATVFHLAGRVHALSEVEGDEAAYQFVNVEGTRNVLAGASACGVRRLVFLSSVKALGGGGSDSLDECHPPRPATAYGRTKLMAEELVLDAGRRQGFHAVCLRLSLVYGPGNKGNLSRMISAIDRGHFPPLPDVGNRRSMVHVSDVVDAAVLAATHPAANGQCYIVTDGRPYSTRELYEAICRGLGKPIPRWHVPLGALKGLARVGDAIGYVRGRRFAFDSDALEKLTGSAWYSSEKIACELGFRPKVTFEDALPEMIDWYRKTRA